MRKRSLLLLPLLLAIHLLLRLGFGCFNQSLFLGLSAHEKTWIFIRGLQQDCVSLLLVNFPVFLLLGAGAWMASPRLQRPLLILARWCFIVGNCFAVALNCIDIGYYRFGRHRANLDLRFVLGDSIPSFKSLFFGYWYLILLFVVLAVMIGRMARWLPAEEPVRDRRGRWLLVLRQVFVIVASLVIMGWIGAGRPVMPSTPLLSVQPEDLPLAQNSLLTWAYSCFHRSHELLPVPYFSGQEAFRLAPTSHQLLSREKPNRKNVVLFILESFSRCYLVPGDPYKAHTPFLDSLLDKSLFFPNSFANGFSSNQGIVAILGGLPALMDEPFYYSEYANTPLHSLGNILRGKGYSTHFFMGAGRDHFGFGTFARIAGIDQTYWREDFNNDRLYDGNWGIFDQPFLQYGGRILSARQQPFLGVFFTISAHPPYTIPAELRSRFAAPDQSAPQQAIAYTDYSLQEFFRANKDEPWFRNTLFVFCADHWLDPLDGATPFSCLNVCTIPFFIYDPSREGRDWRATVAGQVDVVPTVLDQLGYQGSYTGYGHSLLDTTIADTSRYVINRSGETYQIIDKEYILGFDVHRDRSSYLYRYPADSACRNDLLKTGEGDAARQRLERLLKANIQTYRQALTRRSLLAF